MLTNGALAFYREHMERAYPDTCVIPRTSAGTSDGMGGVTGGTSTAGTYACRVAPAGMPAFEKLTASQVQGVDVYTITFPALTDVRPTDTINVGARVFQVTGGTGDRSWELSKRVLAVEINEGVSS